MPELITRRKFLYLAGIVTGVLGLAKIGVDINKYLQAERENARLIQSLLTATQLSPTTDRKALAILGFHAQFENPEMGENLDFGTWHRGDKVIKIKTNEQGELQMPNGYGLKYPEFPNPNLVDIKTYEGETVVIHTYGTKGTTGRINNQPELIAFLNQLFGTVKTVIRPEIHLNFLPETPYQLPPYHSTNSVYSVSVDEVKANFQEKGLDFAACNVVTHPNISVSIYGFTIYINFDKLHKYAQENGLTNEQAIWLALANEYNNVFAFTHNPREASKIGKKRGSEWWSTALGWLAALAPEYRSAIFGQVDIKDLQDGVDLLAEEMSILAKLN